MQYRATPQEIEAFAADGAVLLRGVIGPEWLERVAAAIQRDIDNPGPFCHSYEAEGEGRFHGNLRVWQNDPDFRAYCFESGLPELAAQFFGAAKVNLLYDQLFVKEPGTANRTRWHNDQPYWSVKGYQILSFWVALDPTTAETGALEFVRGSHRWGRFYQPEVFGRTNVDEYERNPDYETVPDIESARGDYDIVSFDLEPGDVYAFHALVLHGAGGNTSEQVRRRGYTVRYTGDDVIYSSHPGTNRALRNSLLKDGDRLDSDQYPLVWER